MKKAAIGIDIGGTFTKYGVVDRDGVNLAEGRLRTTDYPAIEDFINTLKSEVNQLIASIPEKPDIIGAGVGAPNGNYYSGTIEYAPNLKWKGVVPFVDLFEKMTGYSTVLTNDANAAAIGEMIYGNARMMTNFIVITLGTGLGSGLVVNGGLVNGHDGFAGAGIVGAPVLPPVRPAPVGPQCPDDTPHPHPLPFRPPAGGCPERARDGGRAAACRASQSRRRRARGGAALDRRRMERSYS